MTGSQGAVVSIADAGRVRSARTRRWAFHLTILVVLVAAFVTSFKGGSHGAYVLGFPPEFLFTAPLICDIVAGLATLVHGWARDDDEMRTWATTFVMIPMLLSWMANAVDHLGRAQPDPTWPVAGQWAWIVGVILFAGLCPVSVASLLFFATKFREFERRAAASEGGHVPADVPDGGSDDALAELEFVEPEPRIALHRAEPLAVEIAPEVQVDAETVREIDEIEIHRVMRDTKPRVSYDVAEIMVRDGVSRATAYRRVKEAGDAALA